MKLILLSLSVCVAAFPQSTPLNTITGSAGYARQLNGHCCQTDTAVSLGVTYGHRVLRYLEAEAGVTVARNPVPEIRGGNYYVDPDDRFIWIPFGVRGILPLAKGRAELSAGGGGLINIYSVSNPAPNLGLASHTGAGGYFTGGGAIAITRSRRFWVGTSAHFYLANINQNTHDRWMTVGGEFSYRF